MKLPFFGSGLNVVEPISSAGFWICRVSAGEEASFGKCLDPAVLWVFSEPRWSRFWHRFGICSSKLYDLQTFGFGMIRNLPHHHKIPLSFNSFLRKVFTICATFSLPHHPCGFAESWAGSWNLVLSFFLVHPSKFVLKTFFTSISSVFLPFSSVYSLYKRTGF